MDDKKKFVHVYVKLGVIDMYCILYSGNTGGTPTHFTPHIVGKNTVSCCVLWQMDNILNKTLFCCNDYRISVGTARGQWVYNISQFRLRLKEVGQERK